MTPENPRPPSEAELDRLLASRLRRTSPEFEQRWRDLRAELADTRPPAHWAWRRWLLWPGLAFAAGLVALLLVRRPPVSPLPLSGDRIAFEELVAFDAALQPATTLLDAENRDALLHLPAPPRG